MWGKKFGFVFKNSLTYPFKHFGDIKGLYFLTAILLGMIYAVNFPMQMHLQEMQKLHQPMDQTAILFVALIILTSILAAFIILPLSVAVVRNVIGGEKAEPDLFGAMFAKRQLQYLWAGIKAILVSIIPLLLFFAAMIIIERTELIANVHLPGGGSTALSFAVISVIAVIIITLYLLLRLVFATVFAALGKGTKLSNSWELTKGNFLLILLTEICVIIVVSLATVIILVPAAFIAMPIMAVAGELGIYIGGFLYGILYTFLFLPSLAVIANLYLVMKSKDQIAAEKEVL